MNLIVEALALPEVRVLRPKVFEDTRGFFSETYNKRLWAEAGIECEFVQDNHSLSAPVATLRGLHFQKHPFEQHKLVRVVRGRIFDVAVDVRRTSPTFGQWVIAEISAEARNQMFVPAGYAHGFCTLEPNTEVIYKVSNFYSPEHDAGIRWNDPDIGIRWPFPDSQVVLSDKDRRLPLLRDI